MNVMPSMHIETDSDWTWTRSIHAFQTCKGWQGGKGRKGGQGGDSISMRKS